MFATRPPGGRVSSVFRAPLFWIGIFGGLFLGSFFVLCGLVLRDGRHDAERLADQTAVNLVQTISQDIGRNIEIYDLSLQGVLKALDEPSIRQLTGRARQMALFDHAATATYLNALMVIDETGHVIDDSRSLTLPTASFADRTYFTAHQRDPELGLFVSEPLRSRIGNGEWILAISRRISKSDGSFGGVVLGTLQLDYFQYVFANLALGENDSVSLFNINGTMIARQPFRMNSIGKDFSRSPLVANWSKTSRGLFEYSATTDGVERRYTFGQVKNLPLIVSVGLSTTDIFAAWLKRTTILGFLMAALFLMIVALTIILTREFARRRAAEESLAAVATTDALTNVANRRAFDARLDHEWQRAARNRSSIALLMIDVDSFKSYNDAFGHLRGDETLKSVARTLTSNVRRPADFGARFGGEEFAVILPETDLRGALHVARRIMEAVSRLKLPHPEGVDGFVSISIGVSLQIPKVGSPAAGMISEADEALYRAKQEGRNRIIVAPASRAGNATNEKKIA